VTHFHSTLKKSTIKKGKNQSWCLNHVKVIHVMPPQSDDYITANNLLIRETLDGGAVQIL